MPIPEQTPVNSYTANGSTTTFVYTFKIFVDADLKVTVDGAVKTLTTDYTVTGAGNAGGGNVVFGVAPANGTAIVIYRDLTAKRDTDYVDGGDLRAQTLDDDIDRVVMLVQQLKDDKNRALKLAKGETSDQVISETAANRANKVIGFDASGALILKIIADLGGIGIGDGLQVLSDVLSAKVGDGIQIVNEEIRVGSELLWTADLISDFVVSGLLGSDPGASLTMTIPGGTAYVIGKRVVKSGSDADLTKTYTASKDTYVDISNTGAITYSEVANGAAAPAVAANSIRLEKVITNATEITGVTDLRVMKPNVAASSGSDEASQLLDNVGIAASIDSNALTIALKGADGNAPSASNVVKIKFRSATLTSGITYTREITAATSIVLSAGSTLGFAANETGRIYVWAIDNAGTSELAFSRTADIFPEGNLVTTTAEGGAGAADSAAIMYSTSARTNVSCRCLCYVEIQTGATAGNWSNDALKIQIMGPGIKRTGDIVQTVRTAKTDTFSGELTTFTNITGLTVAITPTSVCNKVRVRSTTVAGCGTYSWLRQARNGTELAIGDAASNRRRVNSSNPYIAATGNHNSSISMEDLDAPASVSALTYSVQGLVHVSGYPIYINRSEADSDTTQQGRSVSIIAATEEFA